MNRSATLNIAKRVVDCFEILKREAASTNTQKKNYLVELALESVFEAGSADVVFTEKEQREIGLLVKDTLTDLDNCILNLGYCFDGDRGRTNLILRSGFQFIIDRFSTFPVGQSDEILNNILSSIIKSEHLEAFDESLEQWKKNGLISWECPAHSVTELKRPHEVPKTHSWWHE